MQKSKKKKRGGRKLPVAYRGLTDAMFDLMIYTIEKIIRDVRTKHILRHPEDKRKTVLGLATSDGIVWLSRSKRHVKKEPMVKTLIHEVLHHIYAGGVPHYHVYRMEKILWRRFTEEQKRFLRQYIPRHTVKSEPQ